MNWSTVVRPMLVVIMTLIAACSTGDRTLQTPQGERPAEGTGPLIILGIASKATSTLNKANANQFFEETYKINVPPGTVIIVPTMRGWMHGYGSVNPEDLSKQPDPNTGLTWHREDHNLGLAAFNVYVVDIDAVDPTKSTQTATIKVQMILSDDNGDDKWWAYVTYTLLFLGPHP